MKEIGYHMMLFNYMTSLLMELFTSFARSMKTSHDSTLHKEVSSLIFFGGLTVSKSVSDYGNI